MFNEKTQSLELSDKELEKLYQILSWVSVATRPSEDERKLVEKILFKIRKLDCKI